MVTEAMRDRRILSMGTASAGVGAARLVTTTIATNIATVFACVWCRLVSCIITVYCHVTVLWQSSQLLPAGTCVTGLPLALRPLWQLLHDPSVSK